jgi:hypothetical protein
VQKAIYGLNLKVKYDLRLLEDRPTTYPANRNPPFTASAAALCEKTAANEHFTSNCKKYSELNKLTKIE